MRSRRPLRRLAALVVTAVAIASGGAAYADTIVYTIDAGLSSMALVVGGPSAAATFTVVPVNGDGKSGCNLTGSATFSASVSSTDPSVATVAPSSITFTSCGDVKTVTVTPVATGTSQIFLTQTFNNTAGSFDVAPARFTVNVSGQTPTTTTVSCPSTSTYTGSALTPCTATTTGSGGFSQNTSVTYSSNINAGTATANASFPGDSTHAASSGSATFTIDKAASTTTVSCPASAGYTGSPVTPACTATATGVGGLNTSVTPVTFTNNTNAGTASASATYAGDTNHLGSTGSTTFTISRASATCTVTGYTGTYDGSSHGATGTCTGIGGAALSGLDLGGSFTNVPGGTASWTFTNPNYASQSGTAPVTIGQATSTVTVNCSSGQVYTGGALMPCTATATGAGGLNVPVTTFSYAANIAAGPATATATYAGDTNHTGSTGSGGFTIDKAPSTVSVTCPASVVYTGSAVMPCTATATGAGPLSVDITGSISYAANLAVGTATASATWAGDTNHTGATNGSTFGIGLAPSLVTLSCLGPITYTSGAQTPCTATVSGAGLSDFTVLVDYADNVVAGTAHASASWAGDANHSGNSSDTTFTIGKATSTTTLSCPTSVTYNGTAQEPCTASATGVGLGSIAVAPTYTNNTNAGTATANAHYDGDTNHDPSDATVHVTINPANPTCTIDGYTGTYDANAHGATGTCHGVGGSTDALTGLNLGASYTDVPGGTAHWSIPASTNYTAASGDAAIVINQAVADCGIAGFAGIYDANPHGATGTCSGVGGTVLGGLSLGGTFTDVAGGTAHWTFTGGTNYTDQSGNVGIVIGQAASVVTLNCPGSLVYTGSALSPCTATATGVGGLSVDVTPVTHTDNVNVGTAGASATYAGDTNHSGYTGTGSFQITPAMSHVVISCIGPFTYTGGAQEPCTATALGVGGLSVDVTASLTYTDNTGAGTAAVNAAYGGDANHDGSTASTTFTIGKAASTTTLTCTSPVTYTGAPRTPCSALATGAGSLSVAVSPVNYTANTDAGTATADATFGGDANHTGSHDSTTFVIQPAGSTTTVSCPVSAVYTGSAQTPCTATVTGPGGLSQAVAPVAHTNNTIVGTASASATYPGDANHLGSTASKSFEITKASSNVVISCIGPFTYTGAAQEPCTATALGVGGLSVDVTSSLTYTDNTGAGTAAVNAAYGGDANHDGSTASTVFTIGKAASDTAVTCPTTTYPYTGSPIIPPCSAMATGPGLASALPVSYTNNTAVGTANASAVFTGDANHLGSTGTGHFQIGAWTLNGFYQPVDMGSVINVVKGGSTVPLKFNAYAGSTEITGLATLGGTFVVVSVNCASNAYISDDLLTTTGGTTLRYDSTGRQWIQNWQTPKGAGNCYRVTLTTADGSALVALFKTK